MRRVPQADRLVTLLHVVEWLAEDDPRTSPLFNRPHRGYLPALDEYRRDMAANAGERLRSLVAAESRTWSEIDTLVSFGRSHREILRVAERSPPT